MTSQTLLPPTPAFGINEPLTEVVLARLPGPRAVWIVLWAATALVAPAIIVAVLVPRGESDRIVSLPSLLASQVAVAWAVVVCIVGASRLWRGSRAIGPQIDALVADRQPIRGVGPEITLAVPLVLTLAISIVNTAGTSSQFGTLASVAAAPVLAASVLAVMTFVWTYLELLLGVARLGRLSLRLEGFPEDRSLGLGRLGSLMFEGFAIVFAAAVPILVTSSTNLSTVYASVLFVGAAVVMLFLSMSRLHGQMRSAKARHVGDARRLVADAYAPLRAAPTLEALEAQASALGPAQALQDRAEKIQEWPVDERMTAFVAVIATGVVTSVLVRLLFAAAGL